jgi:small subunit ribosomal protein S9
LTEIASYIGTGRRKTATAQVRLFDGKGIIMVNDRPFDEYFKVERQIRSILAPLVATSTRKDFDITVKVKGGGPTGQAGAIILGIARALAKVDREHQMELRHRGFLTRDARAVERKKAVCHKARRGKQFSKR